MQRVRAFVPGKDAVGVFCPSHSISQFPRRFERGLANLLASFSSPVKLAPGALGRFGRLSGDAAMRVTDLEALLRDPEVGLILCGTGGYNSIEVAMALDLDLFRATPKPIVGFSDATALLLDLYRRTSVVTFHGPALLPNFGEAAPLSWQAGELARMVVASPAVERPIGDPPQYSEAYQFWDRDDDGPPARVVPPKRRSFTDGRRAADRGQSRHFSGAGRRWPDARNRGRNRVLGSGLWRMREGATGSGRTGLRAGLR
jgi:LD-carboxypeptidase N-terminal domain